METGSVVKTECDDVMSGSEMIPCKEEAFDYMEEAINKCKVEMLENDESERVESIGRVEIRQPGTPTSTYNTHECHVCGKLFDWKSSLKTHSLVHSGVKEYECQSCGKRFGQKSTLNQHALIHSGVKRFECEICRKWFSRRSHLTSHSLVHTGIKEFSCQVCGKTFTHNFKLTQHTVVHSGVKKFKCELCGKYFTRKDYVKYHLSTVHKEDVKSKSIAEKL